MRAVEYFPLAIKKKNYVKIWLKMASVTGALSKKNMFVFEIKQYKYNKKH